MSRARLATDALGLVLEAGDRGTSLGIVAYGGFFPLPGEDPKQHPPGQVHISVAFWRNCDGVLVRDPIRV